MKIEKTPLNDCFLIQLDRFDDSRGSFTVRHSDEKFRQNGLDIRFIQDNHSRSKPAVLRGLHYQTNPSQGKLVTVLRGRIFDVAIDLRKSSSTFKKIFTVELSESSATALWVPRGFAHGFCVLGESDADVLYKVDAPYTPSAETGFRYDDPTLAIQWPIKKPILSDKDLVLPSFESYLKNPTF